MKAFNYNRLPTELFSPQVTDKVAQLHEYKGKLEVAKKTHAGTLSALASTAHLDNVNASARIEGIYIKPERISELIAGSEPSTSSEAETRGYAEAFDYVSEYFEDIEIQPSFILNLNRRFLQYTDYPTSGAYRRNDDAFTIINGKRTTVPVSPVQAFETPLALGAICDTLADVMESHRCDPLVLIPVFTVDFLCVHPFHEGNGRMSRLLVQLLLLQSGFDISRYVSVDKLIEANAQAYYDSLNTCAIGWDKGKNHYAPFATFWLNMLCMAHASLFEQIDFGEGGAPLKSERVRLVFEKRIGKVTKHDILEACPDVSIATVESALGELVKSGYIDKVGGGRTTGYVRHI